MKKNLRSILRRSSRSIVTKWLGTLFVGFVVSGNAFAQSSAQVSDVTRAQIAALMRDKEARTPVQKKISSQLLAAAKLRRDGFINKGVPRLQPFVRMEADGR